MSARIGAATCHCCGEPESTGGCVLGLRCGCQSRSQCDLCKKCDEHHVAECSDSLRTEFDLLMIKTAAEFRERHHINIFGAPTNVERRGFGLRGRIW